MIRISALALCLVAFPAMAQPAGDNLRRQFDPGDPAVKGASIEYRSVFDAEPAQQPEPTWSGANEEMSKLRGHAGHIREPGQGSAPASTTAAPAARPTSPHNQH